MARSPKVCQRLVVQISIVVPESFRTRGESRSRLAFLSAGMHWSCFAIEGKILLSMLLLAAYRRVALGFKTDPFSTSCTTTPLGQRHTSMSSGTGRWPQSASHLWPSTICWTTLRFGEETLVDDNLIGCRGSRFIVMSSGAVSSGTTSTMAPGNIIVSFWPP